MSLARLTSSRLQSASAQNTEKFFSMMAGVPGWVIDLGIAGIDLKIVVSRTTVEQDPKGVLVGGLSDLRHVDAFDTCYHLDNFEYLGKGT